MDLDQILPQLLAGACPQTTEDIDTLKDDYDISAVLSLQTDDELACSKTGWDSLEAHYRAADIEFRRVPTPDPASEAFRRRLPECARVLDGLLRQGHKVYIHCGTGTCRAPTVVIAYLHWAQDWDIEEALDYVTACRTCNPQVEAIRLASEDRQRDPMAFAAVTLIKAP